MSHLALVLQSFRICMIWLSPSHQGVVASSQSHAWVKGNPMAIMMPAA